MPMSHDGHSSALSSDETMIAHHEGALDVVLMIKDSTKAEVKRLYNNIVTSQSAEIEAMKALLK